jgi:hypothetical protein
VDLVERPVFSTPSHWLIAFHTRVPSRWCSLLALGHFKHVSAFGFMPAENLWLFYDVSLRGMQAGVIPATEAGYRELTRLHVGATLVRMPARRGPGVRFRFGFWCVPAVKHLLGIRCMALRPDALYRWCRRNGGVQV